MKDFDFDFCFVLVNEKWQFESSVIATNEEETRDKFSVATKHCENDKRMKLHDHKYTFIEYTLKIDGN